MVFVYWDELPEVNLENMLKELVTQIGKAKVREHPMPRYAKSAAPPMPWTPEQVLTEYFGSFGSNDIINQLKKHGFEITPTPVQFVKDFQKVAGKVAGEGAEQYRQR